MLSLRTVRHGCSERWVGCSWKEATGAAGNLREMRRSHTLHERGPARSRTVIRGRCGLAPRVGIVDISISLASAQTLPIEVRRGAGAP
jgi:hypothetical protein